VDHVISTNQQFARGSIRNDTVTDELARQWQLEHDSPEAAIAIPPLPDWILPIQDSDKTIGLLVVGELQIDVSDDASRLSDLGHLVEVFWRHIRQADALTSAHRTDWASGSLNRIDLTRQAERILNEAAADGEPTVVLALSVEGVRRLDDGGDWELRNWLMQQIGVVMQHKLRTDDLVGRFSDDRFVAVLRRLDATLGEVIAGKLLGAVTDKISCQPVIKETISLRCGLVESRGESFDDILVRSFDALRRAREAHKILMVEGNNSKITSPEVLS
jgi:GGDEF domain-containing protein